MRLMSKFINSETNQIWFAMNLMTYTKLQLKQDQKIWLDLNLAMIDNVTLSLKILEFRIQVKSCKINFNGS